METAFVNERAMHTAYLAFLKIEAFIRTKQWWDTIDSLVKIYTKPGLRDKRIDQLMLTWSTNPDFWVRRVAIEHQLLRKKQTNSKLLAQIIENNLNSNEFFINKAIGWALRDYSKTDPNWVKQFIVAHQKGLSKLSINEALRYLKQKKAKTEK